MTALAILNQELSTTELLRPLDPAARQFDEAWLQELLFSQPSLLPMAELDTNLSEPVALAREFPVASGAIDLLYVTWDGALCFAETKLWRNPEAHRTVLAQVLDYARSLSTLRFEAFRDTALRVAAKSANESDVKKLFGPSRAGFDSLRFEAGLRDSLQTGRFVILIVGDRIRPDVALLSEIIGTAPNLEFSLGLVELNLFHLRGNDPWPLVAAPTLVGRSREVTRAVVKIRYEDVKPEVEVAAFDETTPGSTHTDQETFLRSLPSGLADIFQIHLDKWAASACTIYWGKVGFSLRYAPHERLETIFRAYPDSVSLFLEKWIPKFPRSEHAYKTYRRDIDSVAGATRVRNRNGCYLLFR